MSLSMNVKNDVIFCPLCHSSPSAWVLSVFDKHGKQVIHRRDMFDLFKCRSCGAHFLNGIIVNHAYYNSYYSEGYYDPTHVSKFKFLRFILDCLLKFSAKRKSNLILKFVPKKEGRYVLLDIGCGKGDYLINLPDNIFDKYGLEINKEGFLACKTRGLNVRNGELKNEFIGQKFDVVTLWHVLEHAENPKELLGTIQARLTDNGILVIQTPNTDSLGFLFGKWNWYHCDSPRHLILYNTTSLKALCDMTGFKIIAVKNEFYDYPLDLFWSLNSVPLRVITLIFYPVLKLFSREHLTFVCKKN